MIAMTTRSSIRVKPKLARSHFARIDVSLRSTNDDLMRKARDFRCAFKAVMYTGLQDSRSVAAGSCCVPRDLLQGGFLELESSPPRRNTVTSTFQPRCLVSADLP